jgi:hypothetical protein
MEFDILIQNNFYLHNLPKDIQNEIKEDILRKINLFDEENKLKEVKQKFEEDSSNQNYIELKKLFTKRSIFLINLRDSFLNIKNE